MICTDKTGTLTQNTLAVLAFVPWSGTRHVGHRAGVVVLLRNDAFAPDAAGDPIDRALLAWAGADRGKRVALRSSCAAARDQPFGARRAMTTRRTSVLAW